LSIPARTCRRHRYRGCGWWRFRLGLLDHAPSRAAAITERGFLAALDVGCTAPAGALAEVTSHARALPLAGNQAGCLPERQGRADARW
jgi:porphobilinogen deaminase